MKFSWLGKKDSGGDLTRSVTQRGWILQKRQLLAGKYRIATLVGTGGMGQVFTAEDIALRRTVAIKVPSLNILEQPGGAERFLHEAREARRLDGSPHIVKIIAYLSGHTEDSPEPLPFIVMEYLGGGNLARRLRDGPMPVKDAMAFFSQICSALSFAHAKGVVHRDLKPENICFDDSGRLVIVDFGIARMLGESYTATMSIAGTAAYMAPEQWNPARGVDHRTDLYAAGVLLFQMLTGRLPFEGTPDQICIAHLKQTAPNACDVRRDIPSALGTAISRAMEKEKERRFQSAVEFADALCTTKHSPRTPSDNTAGAVKEYVARGDFSSAIQLLRRKFNPCSACRGKVAAGPEPCTRCGCSRELVELVLSIYCSTCKRFWNREDSIPYYVWEQCLRCKSSTTLVANVGTV